MAEATEGGLLADCRTCRRVMWAGYGRDCPGCRAEREAERRLRAERPATTDQERRGVPDVQ